MSPNIVKLQATKFRASTLEICHDKIEPLTTGFSEGICREANPRFSFLLDLDDSMFVKTSTPGEWIAQGDYYAKHQCWKVSGESACPGASSGLTSRSLITAFVTGTGASQVMFLVLLSLL